uniref:Ubiquitin carboxyl-terminal hydrolase MINDY n=1 Tax=Terrapene triunguis TaxID=2587831 RepID=A0A674IVL7_9SAUR
SGNLYSQQAQFSLVLSGLKKTSAIMDREFPRTALSINNRNELRNVLHLQSLYKQNKAKENPLKTILEVITNYFLEHFGTTRCITSPAASVLQAKSSQSRCIETSSVNDYSDEDMLGRTTVSDASKTEVYRYRPILLYMSLSPVNVNKHVCLSDCLNKKDDLKITETSEEMKTTMREKQRSRSGLIVRGMMAGPTASSQEDSVKRRLLKRSSGINSIMQFNEEDHQKNSSVVPTSDFQEIKGTSTESMSYLSSHNTSSLKVDMEFSSKISSNSYTTSVSEKLRHTSKDTADPLAKLLSERERTKVEERKSMASFDIDTSEKNLRLSEIKNLLFGSSLCCFSEEWKIQNFTFNSIPQLKYGIIQKKFPEVGCYLNKRNHPSLKDIPFSFSSLVNEWNFTSEIFKIAKSFKESWARWKTSEENSGCSRMYGESVGDIYSFKSILNQCFRKHSTTRGAIILRSRISLVIKDVCLPLKVLWRPREGD